MFKKLAVSILLLIISFSQNNLSAQGDLYTIIKNNVTADITSSGWDNTIKWLSRESGNPESDVITKYSEELSSKKTKPVLTINTIVLDDENSYVGKVMENTPEIDGFYKLEPYSSRDNFTFIFVKNFFDSKATIKENIDVSLKNEISKLKRGGYRTVIFIDDFGLSEAQRNAILNELRSENFTSLLLHYDYYREHFPHNEYYYVDLKYKEVTEKNTSSFYKALAKPGIMHYANLVTFLPSKSDEMEIDHFINSIYTYARLKRNYPLFGINLYVLDPNGNGNEKKVFQELLTKNGVDMGSIMLRNVDLSNVNMNGKNIPDPQTSIFGSQTNFKINFTDTKNLEEEWIVPHMDDFSMLIVGKGNGKNIWVNADQYKTDDFVRFLGNYLSKVSKSPETKTSSTSDRSTFRIGQ